MIDPNSTTQHFRRAQLREPSLRQPCGKCPACVAKRPRECVRMKPELVLPPDFGHIESEKRDLPDPAAQPNPECGCRACNPAAWWMVVCKICGNKRCPHAEDHGFECSGSNAVGQTPKIGPSRDQTAGWVSVICKLPHTPSNRTETAIPATFMPAAVSDSGNGCAGMFFVIPGQPMGKPRMTQRDVWKKRPCVVRYRAWTDKARAAAGKLTAGPQNVSWTAYFAMPKSWLQSKKDKMRGGPHQQKPDRDNCDKALLDSLFKDDSGISDGTLRKRWDDGNGPRMEVRVW